MSYRQPAMIRDQQGLGAANQAIKDFNQSMAEFGAAGADRKRRQRCQENPTLEECKKKKDDDDDDDDDKKDDSQNQAPINPKNPQANTKPKASSITSQVPPPVYHQKGGLKPGGAKQNFSANMYDDYTKRKDWSKKNNYKYWEDDTES